MNKKEEQKKDLKKISVYCSSKLKKEIIEYKEQNHFKSLSSMFVRAFLLLRDSYSSINTQSRISLEDRLSDIQEKLESLNLKKELLENEDKLIENQASALDLKDLELSNTAIISSKVEIPDFDKISEEILAFIEKMPNRKIKDFVIMNHFRKSYSEGIIWSILLHLRDRKKLRLENGLWVLNVT